MTDNEFLILDDLYFLIDYKTLQSGVLLDDNIIKNCLKELIEKEWVAVHNDDSSIEIKYDNLTFEENFKSYYYLATKKGLFEHNSN